MHDRQITPNQKRTAMAARHAASAPMGRGDIVTVVPDRGYEFRGLFVQSVSHPLYGSLYDVLVAGSIRRFDAERVSRRTA